MELPACTADYQTGYRGLTAQGQTWTEEHKLLENQIVKAQGPRPQTGCLTSPTLPPGRR